VLNSIYSRSRISRTPTADLVTPNQQPRPLRLGHQAHACRRRALRHSLCTATPAPGSLTFNDVAEDHGNYTLGANWRASSLLTLRAEVFNKDHKNRFDGYDVTTGTQYVLGYDFTGVKLTATLKPLPTLSLTRAMSSEGTCRSFRHVLRLRLDGRQESHVRESLDWTPTRQFYFQGNVNVVFDDISTVYPRAGVAANGLTPTPSSRTPRTTTGTPAPWRVSLWTQRPMRRCSTPSIEPTISSLNWQPRPRPTAPASPNTRSRWPQHKFSNRLVGSARVGYFSSKNDTTGGFTNYNGVLAYLSLDYKL